MTLIAESSSFAVYRFQILQSFLELNKDSALCAKSSKRHSNTWLINVAESSELGAYRITKIGLQGTSHRKLIDSTTYFCKTSYASYECIMDSHWKLWTSASNLLTLSSVTLCFKTIWSAVEHGFNELM